MGGFAAKVMMSRLGKTAVFSVGQAGFLIRSKRGALLGLDLYLSECVERLEGHAGFKRLLPKILDPFDLEMDCLVATHPHWDHFDMDAVPSMMANGRTRLFASVNCAADVIRLGMAEDRVCYVRPGDSFLCEDFFLQFINCDHGTGAPDAVGVLIEVDGKRICVVGDSCLRLDRREEYLSRGHIDVLIAPVNGAYGNLNEPECAELTNALRPGVVIPCHYGMFASHGGNPGRFMDIMNTQYPDQPYCLMAMGEGLFLD